MHGPYDSLGRTPRSLREARPMTATAFSSHRRHRRPFAFPPCNLLHTHHSIDCHRPYRRYTSNYHTYTPAMFRRVAATVPQAGRALATTARPMIASPVRSAAAPVTAAVHGRRQYHEKDKFPLSALPFARFVWSLPDGSHRTLGSQFLYPNVRLTSSYC